MANEEEKKEEVVDSRLWMRVESAKLLKLDRIDKELVRLRFVLIIVSVVLLFFHLGELAYARFFK